MYTVKSSFFSIGADSSPAAHTAQFSHWWRDQFGPVNNLWCVLLSTLCLHHSFRQEVFHFSDMLFRIPYFLLVFVFWGSVYSGPQTSLNPNITDQELFWGADQYDFSVVLPAAGTECFWHFAHYGEIFYLNFMVSRDTEYVFFLFVLLLCCYILFWIAAELSFMKNKDTVIKSLCLLPFPSSTSSCFSVTIYAVRVIITL